MTYVCVCIQDNMCVCVCVQDVYMYFHYVRVCVYRMLEFCMFFVHYGVATISRLLEIIGLFCKRAL